MSPTTNDKQSATQNHQGIETRVSNISKAMQIEMNLALPGIFLFSTNVFVFQVVSCIIILLTAAVRLTRECPFPSC